MNSINNSTIGEVTQTWLKQSGLTFHFQSEMKSTNDFAKELPLKENQIQVVLTDHQTQGRGRKVNQWIDQYGKQLLCSWVFDLPQTPQPTTSCRVGLALAQALHTTWPWLHISLKAPNDIYLSGKKVAGILIENVQQNPCNRMIIGIGLNVLQKPQLETATSLFNMMPNNPFQQQDWFHFIDRLFLELTFAVTQCEKNLSLHDRSSLLFYLNLFEGLNDKYISIDEVGNLQTKTKNFSWADL